MARKAWLLITVGAASVILASCGIAYFLYLAPSADLDRYARYYVDDRAPPSNGAVRVTFLGASSLLFDDGETQLMTDGFLTRPSLFQAAMRKLETDGAIVSAALDRAKANRLAAVFVAHSHYDHALDAAYVARRTGARLLGSPSTLNIGRGSGLPEWQMSSYELGREVPFGDFRVTILASRHSPPIPGVNSDIGQVIGAPLRQPADARAYREGGSFDMLIRHGPNIILVKPSANYIPGALDGIKADVLFLGTAGLGNQDEGFRNAYYDQTVGAVGPDLLIPIHWDDFFSPLSNNLLAAPRFFDDTGAGLDFVISRASRDAIQVRMLQGYGSILLFQGERRQGD